ncbi:MAG: class E sortase [Lachnospiraceae bacterium]|nr:class E sortase [Lachnospiraceae bacterium]
MKRFLLCLATLILSSICFLFLPGTKINIQEKKETTFVNNKKNPTTIFTQTPITTKPKPTLDLYSRDKNLPYDKLFITKERQHYKSGDFILHIPKLKLTEPVQDGTKKEALNKGPGLYEYSQLPGEGDRNVSIAAHRNKSHNGIISEWFFYYIDTLCDGDFIYLSDKEKIYRYKYDKTTIVEETDWSPIYSQGISCITLTSCEPIGVADHRIIVRAILDSIDDYKEDYVYQ